MEDDKIRLKSTHINTTCSDNDWTLSIQKEDFVIIQASFPSLSHYTVLIDGEPILGMDTISRLFSMSPYNYYECELHWVGDSLLVDAIVVRNSLLDGDVVHCVSVVGRT